MKLKAVAVLFVLFLLNFIVIGRVNAQEATVESCTTQLGGVDVEISIEAPVQVLIDNPEFDVEVEGDNALQGEAFSILFYRDNNPIPFALGAIEGTNYGDIDTDYSVYVANYSEKLEVSYKIDNFVALVGEVIQVRVVSTSTVLCSKNIIISSGTAEGGDSGFDETFVRSQAFCETRDVEGKVEGTMVSNESYDIPVFCSRLTNITLLCEDNKERCTIFDSQYCCEKGKVTATDSDKGCDSGEDYQTCLSCMYIDTGEKDVYLQPIYTPTGAIWTSLGCIDPSPSGVITRLYQIGIGIVGGLILLIKVPQIVIAYNSGDPEKIQEAQTGIWSIAGGLLLLVFATIVLETLGVHVIGLPSGFI